LKPRAALSLGLVVHELVTNAVKYGALSNNEGRVSIKWVPGADDGMIKFDWQESGGPAVTSPTRQGLGLKLVDREMSYNLGGASNITFDSEGLNANLTFSDGADGEVENVA
jgi:two-component sensor histidine kinase